MQSLYSPGHLAEGIVFHHSDGRRAKIKRKDFVRQPVNQDELSTVAVRDGAVDQDA
jgi:hypothetical protein